MNILGIDSSGLVASAAIVRDDVLIAEFTVNNKQTHSQTLLPMIEKVVEMSGVALDSLDAIAIAAGPGSFTGLRIGASTAKGLAMVVKCPIISIPTLEGLAFHEADCDGILCPIMDARRNQVYTGLYRRGKGKLEVVKEQCAMDIHELVQLLANYEEEIHFLGDGVPVYRKVIEEEFSGKYSFAPAHLARQSAASIAVLAQKYFEEGKTETAAEHKPIYLRKSQAEREREQKLHEDQKNA